MVGPVQTEPDRLTLPAPTVTHAGPGRPPRRRYRRRRAHGPAGTLVWEHVLPREVGAGPLQDLNLHRLHPADPPPSLATSSVLGPDQPAAEPGPDPHQRLSRPWARKYAYAPDRGKFGGPEHRQAAEMGVRLSGRQASGPVARKTSRLAHRRSSWMAPFRRGRLFGSSAACASSTTNTLPANPSIHRALCFVVSAAGDRYQRRGLFGTTAAEAARGQSLEQRLAEEEPDPIGAAHESLDGATTVVSGAMLPRR